jgi:acetyl-CoA synthetase
LAVLQRHAERDPAWFWGLAADDLAFAWQRPPNQVMDVGDGPEWTRWWGGGRFNYAAAGVDTRAADDPEGLSLTWEGEDGLVKHLTNAALKVQVDRVAGMLSAHGVGPGDRVGLFLPMLLETAVAVLAVSRLGAIYTPIFSGYAAPAAAARLRDCAATLLITADGFFRRGKIVPLKATADLAVADAPSVREVIVIRRIGAHAELPWTAGRDVWWDEALADNSIVPLVEAPETEPEAPFMIIYTSGTAGRPKGAVHVHGGFPIKSAQDLAHDFELGQGDTLFWLTDLGWMMGPWAIIGALLLGATLVLYEGAPDYPGPDRLWSLVARHRVSHLGLSPTVIRALMAHGPEPVRAHDLSSLRVLGSTGEPWDPESWWWFFREIGGGHLPIVNYSGGTELSGGILSGNLLSPIKPCAFAGPSVGTAADVVGADGSSVRGVVGELAIRQPLPGMTRGFWNDRERYLDAYWRRVPGTWIHGDLTLVDSDGHWFIHGRSDDTLKVAGKRVGPAEVESAAISHPAVLEAAAIGVPHEIKGECIVILCVLRPGETDTPDLRFAIVERVVEELGKALAPEAVVAIPALPKTRSGKVMRRLARAAWTGTDLGDISSLEDPLVLQAIRVARASAAR